MESNNIKVVINGVEYEDILNCEITFSYIKDGIESNLNIKPITGCVDKLHIELDTTDRGFVKSKNDWVEYVLKMKDTVELMLSDKFEDRLKAEYLQAKIRFDKLYRYIRTPVIGEDRIPSKEELNYLIMQEHALCAYMRALMIRAEYLGIDLPED